MPAVEASAVPAIVLDDRGRAREVVTTGDINAATWRIAIRVLLPAVAVAVTLIVWSVNRQRDIADTQAAVASNTLQIRANTSGIEDLRESVSELRVNIDTSVSVSRQILNTVRRRP